MTHRSEAPSPVTRYPFPMTLVVFVARRRRRSRRPRVVPFDLEVELLARVLMIADLVHRRGVENAAVDDRVVHALGVADALERIGVEHDEIGELAGFE